ncbi:putative S-adenosylmethionine-dependent methyltransferase [Kockovaella imperatae]|uniref:tRNA N(3)-methylcytidine methyltransferase n=1 Tax=Kockovaella imperatae TaxID=4999 RepID=A0A1Y1U942_9TREE|nr:putative S-adenosylmethionine-dependent methyltransferase [Kockovaella imperatae]ORX34064.1 putative S-adenosylmethionine-dependent methyltransferase [Kockovaella imperatae]
MEASQSSLEAGPSRPTVSAADKWVKPNGPPVGVTFGARTLGEDQDVWEHNTWDHVELPADFQTRAAEAIERQLANPVAQDKRDAYNEDPERYWNAFYANHKDQFFKDRSWLRSEFPELIECSEANAGPKVVLEVGCGAGNSIFTLMKYNENPELEVYATDYSSTAVEVVKNNPMFPCPDHGKGKIRASVWDITSEPSSTSPYGLPDGIEPGSVDVLTVIYVLSALHPSEWERAIHNLYTALKPGGLLLLRDYGRHDLTQLRIKKDRLLDPNVPNLYIRGDGTRVYYFDQDDLTRLLKRPSEDGAMQEMFEITQLGEDRRMIVNRKLKLQMFRIWMQVKARKRAEDDAPKT